MMQVLLPTSQFTRISISSVALIGFAGVQGLRVVCVSWMMQVLLPTPLSVHLALIGFAGG